MGDKNWIKILDMVARENEMNVQLASFANIAGADINFRKGYGVLKINVPAEIAADLTNGSDKYCGGLLLIDRKAYDKMKNGGANNG